jgi:hypothetical protein
MLRGRTLFPLRNTGRPGALLESLSRQGPYLPTGASMQRTIWEWIVKMDDRIGDVMLDAGIAVALAAVGTAVLRSLLAYL